MFSLDNVFPICTFTCMSVTSPNILGPRFWIPANRYFGNNEDPDEMLHTLMRLFIWVCTVCKDKRKSSCNLETLKIQNGQFHIYSTNMPYQTIQCSISEKQLLYDENKKWGMSCNSLWIPTFVV